MSLRAGKRVAALLAVLAVPLAAGAFIPEADRIARAIARANIDANRDQPLRFEVILRIAGGPVVAQGELETHPMGFARLEMRGANGLTERHLLSRAGYVAARNGEALPEPRAFVPPFFLLQADSVRSVFELLSAFGIDPRLVALAPCGEENCYVLGDAARVPPPWVPGSRPSDSKDAVLDSSPTPITADAGTAASSGALWVEKEGFDPRSLRSRGGTRVDLGPGVVFGSIRSPAWFEVQEEGRDTARFEIQGVSASSLAPTAFDRAWVLEASPASRFAP